LFWNVAGMGNKDKKFWESLKKWEIIVLMETWMEKKGWEKVKDRLPEGFKWGVQWATKDAKRERARGGMIMGVKEALAKEEIKIGDRGSGDERDTHKDREMENYRGVCERWYRENDGEIREMDRKGRRRQYRGNWR